MVLNKSELLAGVTVNGSMFNPNADSTTSTIQPAQSLSSTSTLFMASVAYPSSTFIRIWSVDGVPAVGPGVSVSSTTSAINTLSIPPSAMQLGSSNLIDTFDNRLLDAVYRDGSLWVSANSACIPSGDTQTRSCLRFIQVQTDSLTVDQDFDFGTNGGYYYYPGVTLDSGDNLISVFSGSSASEFPSVYASGRLASDPLNTLQPPVLIKAGEASYALSRWGDYSSVAIDPADQTQAWGAGEYATADGDWGTWIAELTAGMAATPTPTATMTATPTATQTAATPTATPTATATATPPAVGPLTFTPSSLNFGTHKFGTTSGAKAVTLKNPKTNTGPVTISSMTLGNEEFAVGNNTCGSSIRLGGKCKFGVVFRPGANGQQNDTLTISDNASNAPQHIALGGIGKGAPLATSTPTATPTATMTATPTATATPIESVSQLISASTGGTITLPNGSSVRIPAGALSTDQTVTLSLYPALPVQPPNASLIGVGPALVLQSASTFASASSVRGKTSSARVKTLDSSSDRLQFVINPGLEVTGLTGSEPLSDAVDLTGTQNFIGIPGAFDPSSSTATGSVPTSEITDISTLAVSMVNWSQAQISKPPPPGQLSWTGTTWVPFSSCPTGNVLVLVHGMLSTVEDAFEGKPQYPGQSETCVQDIQADGHYDNVVGYNYSWTGDITASGDGLADFLHTLAACPGVTIDLEAHSQGGVVALYAASQNTAPIRNFIGLGAPILGDPLANISTNGGAGLVTVFADEYLPTAYWEGLPSGSLNDTLNSVNFKQLVPDSPLLTSLAT